jgi:hypothetical protein
MTAWGSSIPEKQSLPITMEMQQLREDFTVKKWKRFIDKTE